MGTKRQPRKRPAAKPADSKPRKPSVRPGDPAPVAAGDGNHPRSTQEG